MKSVCGRAKAKINLTLTVKGKKDDMHLLDTVIYPIGLYDTVTVTERIDDIFTVSYDNGKSYENDTVKKAYFLLKNEYLLPGLDVAIKKRIPEGAGLGGSSADAACFCRLVRLMFGITDISTELLEKIGSDVPSMYLDAPTRMVGTGRDAKEISIEPLDLFVLAPAEVVSTAKCFALYDEIGGEGGDTERFLSNPTIEKPFNALSKAAKALCPATAEAMKAMKDVGFSPCVTGSGSAVFCIGNEDFPDKAKLLTEIGMEKGFFTYIERKIQR